jgi:hypothetical protein
MSGNGGLVVVVAACEPRCHRLERWPPHIARGVGKTSTNNLPQDPHSAGEDPHSAEAYDAGYVILMDNVRRLSLVRLSASTLKKS